MADAGDRIHMIPDYYAMLDVDPGADRAAIEAALGRCQPRWSAGTRNPKNKHRHQSYLDQIPALRQAILSTAEARATYDALRETAQRAAHDLARDELARLVRLRAAKGGLTVGDRDRLRDEAARRGLAREDADALIGLFPPRPDSPTEVEADDGPAEIVDAAMRQQIRIALEHLDRRDLYAVLDLPRDAPEGEILAQADALRRRWMHKTQVTAEKTAWLEAVSYAQSHLGTAAARARYDRTLLFEAEEGFAASVGFALEGLAELEPGSRQALIEEAGRLGIAPERAEALIRRYCRGAGVALMAGPGAAPAAEAPRLLRCRSCAGWTVLKDRRSGGLETPCAHCGAALSWGCPVCRRRQAVDQPRCGCGFELRLLEPVERSMEAAQDAYRQRDYEAAMGHLEAVLARAPRHPAARRASQRIAERQALVEQARSAWEVAQSRARMGPGRAALAAWAQLVPARDSGLRVARAELARRLAGAANLVAQARAALGEDPTRARELLRQSQALAADLPEAREALGQCPPDPPRDLRLTVADRRVHLRWTAALPDGLGPLRYVVVRKPEGIPEHAADGVLVAESDLPEWTDTNAEPGTRVGYAVFSRRADATGPRGAEAGPVRVWGEVSELRVDADRAEVRLRWRLPEGAIGARVQRRGGADPDAAEVIANTGSQAVDGSVHSDQVYQYTIQALYRGEDGGPFQTPGKTVTAVPHEPGHAVVDLRLSRDEAGRTRLEWTPPEQGLVRILRSAHLPPLPAGARTDLGEADGFAGDWIEAIEPGRAIDLDPPALGILNYTPMTLLRGEVTVGASASLSCLADPGDLRAARVSGDGRVLLRWRWSPQATATLVLARSGADPEGPDDPAALRFVVSEAEYVRRGRASINLPAADPGPWHLAVRGLAMVDGQPLASAGLDPTARIVLPGPHPEVVLSYALRPPRFPGRSWTLVLRTEPPGQAIPSTVLVVHPRTVPLSVEDGEIVDQFPSCRDGARLRVRGRRNLAAVRARLFTDPRSDPATQAPIRLRHPEAGGTRV